MGTACNVESRPDAIYYGHQIKDLRTLMRNTFLPPVFMCVGFFLFVFLLDFYFHLFLQSILLSFISLFFPLSQTHTVKHVSVTLLVASRFSVLVKHLVPQSHKLQNQALMTSEGLFNHSGLERVTSVHSYMDLYTHIHTHRAVMQWVSSEVGPEGHGPFTGRKQHTVVEVRTP